MIYEVEHLVKSGVLEVTLVGQNVNSYGVYTNKPFGGAYRGFGLPELMGGLEAVVDAIAYRIG
ncbi:molybdopterin cofactor-binding domain-containing protein, partial [Acetomicrobium sp. S15 = DSM 107314]|uniref:molybdopterin cofactor-binding domain-containing protein n=1 Tax=Acetomicrobium sp. S15 = DSM 107314 TaxID=2529858 RepID=UPI0018E0C7AA